MSDPIVGGAPPGEAWFIFARDSRRMTGYPANWKGLVFLLGSITGVVALGAIAAWVAFVGGQWWWLVAYWGVAFPSFFILLFRVMRAKGRRVLVPDGPEPINVRINRALRDDAAAPAPDNVVN